MYDEPGGPHLGRLVRERYIPMVMAVRSIEKPVIAALNGVAAGAGSSLALACDLRIASERASFVQAFVRIGLIPDTGGTLLLPLLVGPARAAELAFGGGRVDAQRALEIGLVERVVAPDELMPAALAWAQELAALPTTAIGLTKRAFNRAFLSRFQEQLELEADLMQEAGQTLDHREGVTAFMEKRPPVYVGR
jgi:2-(1,2-epoxy-1,2-dihydrophenyl)acetyl-CoA isomerase